MTDAEDALLYQSASETVKQVLIDGGRTSVREDAVLVLETINLLKGWSSELADEETSGSLWNYIFLQYGFNPENSEAAANRLYNYFRGAIKGTLAHYKRFFAPEGTQRYYTSLLLHALAPKQSIEALYSIERTDIKGCLFYTSVDGCMIFSVVLYDAVAGGAGHVRRIVTADGQAFQRVLAKAISVVDNCDCDSSCYRCLRNYYNQKIHDNLNRNQASAFLHQWVGNMNPLPMETIE